MKSSVAVMLICLAATTAVQAQGIGSPRAGLRIARADCAECHRVANERAYSPHPDAPGFQQIADTRGMTTRALTAALRTSHKTMPNLIIPNDEIRDIVAYIMSLRRER